MYLHILIVNPWGYPGVVHLELDDVHIGILGYDSYKVLSSALG